MRCCARTGRTHSARTAAGPGMRRGAPASAGGAAGAKGVQQHLTLHLRTAGSFDTSAPLLNPNMASESSAWMRCDPRDFTAVLRVTYAKDGDHAPVRHSRGWYAVPEDNLRWV
eukprot:gene48352-48083_t